MAPQDSKVVLSNKLELLRIASLALSEIMALRCNVNSLTVHVKIMHVHLKYSCFYCYAKSTKLHDMHVAA